MIKTIIISANKSINVQTETNEISIVSIKAKVQLIFTNFQLKKPVIMVGIHLGPIRLTLH